MRIAYLGDIHGGFDFLDRITQQAKDGGADLIIQVGDFGFYPHLMSNLMKADIQVPIYCIDGNHENFVFLEKLVEGCPVDMVPIVDDKVWFIKRGSVIKIGGLDFGFLGGAASVDKSYRTPMVDWFPQEQITDEDINRFASVERLDRLITHTPPNSVVQAYFDPQALYYFGLTPTWRDPSAIKLDELWERLGRPMLYCGHMHKKVLTDDHKCRILDTNELVYEDI